MYDFGEKLAPAVPIGAAIFLNLTHFPLTLRRFFKENSLLQVAMQSAAACISVIILRAGC